MDDALPDPERAVEILARLLSAKDWPALARLHDLEGTALRAADLESGAYFVAGDSPPPPGHGPIRRPFTPGYRYESHEIRGDEAAVTVSCAIAAVPNIGSATAAAIISLRMCFSLY